MAGSGVVKTGREGDGLRREAEEADGGDVRFDVCGAGDWTGGAADRDLEADYGDRCELQEESGGQDCADQPGDRCARGQAGGGRRMSESAGDSREGFARGEGE